MINKIKEELNVLSEKGYRDFSSKLTGETALPILGVRLPALRKIATEINKNGKAEIFFAECDFSSIEMCMIYSYLLGKQSYEIAELLRLFDNAAQYVDNWSTCDILCQSFKQSKKYREEVWKHLIEYVESGKTFYMRIAVVTMLSHFLTDQYVDRVLDVVNTARNDGYYYNMGVAWCVATAMAKYPQKTFAFLETASLENNVYNKAIQKMLESRRVSDEDKAKLRLMKRK